MNIQMINKEIVAESLSMERCIELMEVAYRELSSGAVDAPLRTALINDGGTVLYKPAYSDEAGIFCAKVVSVFADNVNKGLPVTPGVIIVNSAETGMPEAIIEAGYLTALRTGAATGVATKVFAAEDVKVGALFGTGGQAAHQLEAMLCAREFETIYVFSGNPANAQKFCEKQAEMAGTCKLIPNPDRAVLKTCEVITTATSFPTALFAPDEISDTVHINAVGSLGPQNTEIDPAIVVDAYVCVDQREACLKEAGEICVPREAGLLPADYAPVEIGEYFMGTEKAPAPKSGVTLFKSVGNAAQDLVCSAEVMKVASERGLGNVVAL